MGEMRTRISRKQDSIKELNSKRNQRKAKFNRRMKKKKGGKDAKN